MKNKRASIPIVTLVVLTLVLTTSTLLLFNLNGKKAVTEIVSSSSLSEMYVQENIAKYYVFVVTSELKKNNTFDKENFMEAFAKLETDEDYMVNLKKTIAEGKFQIDETHFVLDEKSFGTGKVTDGLSVSYVSDLYVDLDKTKGQEYYLNGGGSFGDDSLKDGILAFKGEGNYEVLSYEECVSGLEQRKSDLEIPEQLCYWEAMTQVYDEKCENLDEADIVEIFQKKAEYRELHNSGWLRLNTQGDFCADVVYDCDQWLDILGDVDPKKFAFFNFNEQPGKIRINPFLKVDGDKIKLFLLHEGLHTIQESINPLNLVNVFGVNPNYDFDDTFYDYYPEFKDLDDNSPDYALKNRLYSAWQYVSTSQELDPRLSEVNRWWFDQTVPNCEVIYTSVEFGNVLEDFLSDSNTVEEYELTKQQLNDVLTVAERLGKRDEVWNLFVSRGPGLVYDPNEGSGILPA